MQLSVIESKIALNFLFYLLVIFRQTFAYFKQVFSPENVQQFLEFSPADLILAENIIVIDLYGGKGKPKAFPVHQIPFILEYANLGGVILDFELEMRHKVLLQILACFAGIINADIILGIDRHSLGCPNPNVPELLRSGIR